MFRWLVALFYRSVCFVVLLVCCVGGLSLWCLVNVVLCCRGIVRLIYGFDCWCVVVLLVRCDVGSLLCCVELLLYCCCLCGVG